MSTRELAIFFIIVGAIALFYIGYVIARSFKADFDYLKKASQMNYRYYDKRIINLEKEIDSLTEYIDRDKQNVSEVKASQKK